MVKVLLRHQQHQSLRQWINSWATAHYGFNTMRNALMLTTEGRRMGDGLKAMDRVKWTRGMLRVEAIDPRMTADEISDFISHKITLQHRKEAQHQERGGQRNWQPRDVRQTDADAAEPATPPNENKPKGSGSASDASEGKPQGLYREVGVQAVEPSWRRCTGSSPPARPTQPASGRSRAAGVRGRCHSASTARNTADQMATAAGMFATGKLVITAMITHAAR